MRGMAASEADAPGALQASCGRFARRVVSAAAARFGVPVARILLADRRRTVLRQLGATDAPLSLEVSSRVAEVRAFRSQRSVAEGPALHVPLVAGETSIGVISFVDARPREFDDAERAAAVRVAATVAARIRKARARAAALRRGRRAAVIARQARAIAEIGRKMSAQHDLDALLAIITESAIELLDAENGALYRHEHGLLVASVARHIPPHLAGLRIAPGQGLVGSATKTHDGLRTNDYPAEPYALPEYATFQKTAIAHPLRSGGDLLGVITVGHRARRRPFSAEDQRLLGDLAAQASVAIENARLYGETRTQLAHLETVHRAALTVSASLELPGVLEAIVARAREVFHCQFATIRTLDHEGALALAAVAGEDPEVASAIRFRPGESVSGRVMQTGAIVTIEDTETEPWYAPWREQARRRGFRGIMVAPLFGSGGDYLGNIGINTSEPRHFTAADRRLLETFAAHAAIAIQNARLFADLGAHAREADALAELTRTLVEDPDLPTVTERIVQRVRALMTAHSAALYLLEPTTGDLRAVASDGGGGPAFTSDVVFAPGMGACGRAVERGTPVWTADILNDPEIVLTPTLRERITAAGYRAVLALPLRVKGTIIGALGVGDRVDRRYRLSEIRLLETIADQVAIFVENARLLEESRRRVNDLETLHAAALAVTRPSGLPQVLDAITEQARKVMGALGANIRFVNARGDLEIVTESGIATERSLPVGPGVSVTAVSRAVTSRSVAVVVDTETDPDFQSYRDKIRPLGVRSIAAAPLISPDERLIGTLTVLLREPNSVGRTETSLLETLAAYAVAAIQHAKLLERAGHEAHQSSMLLEATRWIGSSLAQDDIVEHASRLLLDGTNAETCSLYRLEGDGATAVKLGDRRPGVEGVATTVDVSADAVAREVLGLRIPVAVDDATRDPRVLASRACPPGHGTLLALPILVGDRATGFVCLSRRATARCFTEAETALGMGLLRSLGNALENSRFYQIATERLTQIESLHAVTQQILESFDLDDRLRVIAEKAARLTGGVRTVIALLDAGARTLVTKAGWNVEASQIGRPWAIGQGGIGVAAERRAGVLVNDYAAWSGEHPTHATTGEIPVAAIIAQPLIARGVLVGAIAVSHRAVGRTFSDADLEILGRLATSAALAVEHAQVHAQLAARLHEVERMQTQLIQSEKLAAIGQLVSGVAHELNNPLAVVVGQAELLSYAKGHDAVKPRLEKILKQAQRCAKIVQNLLMFARPQTSERVAMDVNEAVGRSLELLSYQLRNEGAAIETRLAPDLPRVQADPHQIHQVLVNILTNARQAIRDVGRPGRIVVTTQAAPGMVQISVRDTGGGISPEHLGRIFDPFFTTRGVNHGTGLGLSICHGIIAEHGGRILAESPPGQGTTIIIELPSVPESSVVPPPVTPGLMAGRRVLVVDDDELVADTLAEMLRAVGHDVGIETAPTRVLDRLARERFDVILCDVRMPELDGPALWDALRQRDPALARRVVFVTGDLVRPDTAEFLARAGVPSLAKPFDARTVREVVARLGHA